MHIGEVEEGENRDEIGPLYSPETYTSDRLGSPLSELILSPLWNWNPVDVCVDLSSHIHSCIHVLINSAPSSRNHGMIIKKSGRIARPAPRSAVSVDVGRLDDSSSSHNLSTLWNWKHDDICLDLMAKISSRLHMIFQTSQDVANIDSLLIHDIVSLFNLLFSYHLSPHVDGVTGIIIDVDEKSTAAGYTLAHILKLVNDFHNVREDRIFLALKQAYINILKELFSVIRMVCEKNSKSNFIFLLILFKNIRDRQSIQEFNPLNRRRRLKNYYEFPEKTTAGTITMNETEQVNRLDEVQQNDILPIVDASESRAGEGQNDVPSICCRSMKKKRMPIEQRIELITGVPQAQEEGHSDDSHITAIVPCATITHLSKSDLGSASHDAEIPSPKETSLDIRLSIKGLTGENKDQQVGHPDLESSMSSRSKNNGSTRKSESTITNNKGKTVRIDEVKELYGLRLDDAAEALSVSRSTLKRFLRKHHIVRWPSPINKRRKSDDSSVEHENNKDSQATNKMKGVCPLSRGLAVGLASGSGIIQYKQQDNIPSQDHAVTEVERSHPIGNKQHVVETQNVASDFAHDQVQNVEVENSVKNMIVKATYKGKIIKFFLPSSSTFEYLQGEVIKRLKLQVGTFSIEHMDDDKDWILTTCDDDLRLAVNSCLSTNATVIQMLIQQI